VDVVPLNPDPLGSLVGGNDETLNKHSINNIRRRWSGSGVEKKIELTDGEVNCVTVVT